MSNWKPFFSVNLRAPSRVALAFLFLGLAPLRAHALGDPLPEQSAYTEMLRADRMIQAEDFTGARIAYRAALELFAALRAQQPEYKPAILEHRMNYCRQKLEALPPEETEAVPAQAADLPSAAAPEPAPESVPPADLPEPEPAAVEPVPAVAREEAAAPDAAELERSIGQREQDLRRREEALKVSLIGLQLERDRMRESVKQVEAERDLALRMLEEGGNKREKALAGDAARLAELEGKIEKSEEREELLRKIEGDYEILRERFAAAQERIVRLTGEVEALKAARSAEPAEEPKPEALTSAPQPVLEPAAPALSAAEMDSLIASGRLDEAAAACRSILKENPEHVDAAYGLARTDWKAGNRRAARRAAVRLSAAAPERGDIQFFCGEIFSEENDFPRALACFEAAAGGEPASAPYRKALAEAYVAAGRFEDALAAFCVLTELDAGDGSAQYNRAALIVKLGDADRLPEARAAYRKALDLGEAPSALLDRKLGAANDE